MNLFWSVECKALPSAKIGMSVLSLLWSLSDIVEPGHL